MKTRGNTINNQTELKNKIEETVTEKSLANDDCLRILKPMKQYSGKGFIGSDQGKDPGE